MPNFGISSFLRVIHFNEKPQKTEIRKRLSPSEGGYDFHASVRRLCTELALNNSTPADILTKIQAIKKLPEKNSALVGVQAFIQWVKENPIQASTATNVTYKSPAASFQITFKPNFKLINNNKTTAVHIWNTSKPTLNDHIVRATLSLFPDLYTENKPDDLAVLCLRSKRLIRLGQPDEQVQTLQKLLVKKIDTIIADIKDIRDGKPRDIGDHPIPASFH